MSFTDGIDISSLQAVEFATGNCIADQIITINGTCIEISKSVDFSTGNCIAEPVVIINGTGLEIDGSVELSPGNCIAEPNTVMNGSGVTVSAWAKPVFPGDNTQEIIISPIPTVSLNPAATRGFSLVRISSTYGVLVGDITDPSNNYFAIGIMRYESPDLFEDYLGGL